MFSMSMSLYDPEDVKPMREELVSVGIQELRTPEEVDKVLSRKSGTVLVVVNSVCGCAAGGARPGVSLALQNGRIPDESYTVFAGVDREATTRARDYFKGYPPSSPSIALFKDGKLVHMAERGDIEGHSADALAERLMAAFDKHCQRQGPSIPEDEFSRLNFIQMCGSQLARKAQDRQS